MIYDCNTHSCLWYFNFIAIPSFVCPKLACIEWLISLNNDRHLFADSFVTVRPIAMKFGWDKENVSCLKLRKFCLNPTNFKRKLTMMSKLDLKKITLTEFRTPVHNGLMQTVNIFCTENEHLHAFNAPTKNRTNRMRASCWFLFLKKIGHYFWRRVYCQDKSLWTNQNAQLNWGKTICKGLNHSNDPTCPNLSIRYMFHYRAIQVTNVMFGLVSTSPTEPT